MIKTTLGMVSVATILLLAASFANVSAQTKKSDSQSPACTQLKEGSSWNRVGVFWLENARKVGIARRFCILRDAIFGMNSGWHEHRNAAGGFGIRIRS